jgi:hypothetical protein
MRFARSTRRIVRSVRDAVVAPFQIPCNPRSARYQELESAVPAYTLPDLLLMIDGTRVDSAASWIANRRPQILELFRGEVYGRSPEAPSRPLFSVASIDDASLSGLATRKEVSISLTGTAAGPAMKLLVYTPNASEKLGRRTPLFLGLNFYGNHTIHRDRGISLAQGWIPNDSLTDGRSPEMLRGVQSSSWPVETILRRGYGLATAYYGDISPDNSHGLSTGIHRWYQEHGLLPRAGDSWGALAGWAWGLSRAMDYLVQDPDVASDKVAVVGHSRLGKATLWAAAQDERFALVISNNSGCGGAALARRRFGETVADINRAFPHWFCENYKQFGGHEDLLTVDQHALLSLIAPRPLYVASAQLDLQADPMGEFLAARCANPVYRLFGTDGLPVEQFPAAGVPVMGRIGYHVRRGRHAITQFDWSQFIAFASKHLGGA